MTENAELYVSLEDVKEVVQEVMKLCQFACESDVVEKILFGLMELDTVKIKNAPGETGRI